MDPTCAMIFGMKRRPGSSVDSLDAAEKVRSQRADRAATAFAEAQEREAAAARQHEERARAQKAHETEVRHVDAGEKERLRAGHAKASDLQALSAFHAAAELRNAELLRQRDEAKDARDAAEATRNAAHGTLIAAEVDRKVLETYRTKQELAHQRARENEADDDMLDAFHGRAR